MRWQTCGKLTDLVEDDELGMKWAAKTQWLENETDRHLWKAEILWYRGMLSYNCANGLCNNEWNEPTTKRSQTNDHEFCYSDGGGTSSRERSSPTQGYIQQGILVLTRGGPGWPGSQRLSEE